MPAFLLTVGNNQRGWRTEAKRLRDAAALHASGRKATWLASYAHGRYPGSTYLLEHSDQQFAIIGYGDAGDVEIPMTPPGRPAKGVVKLKSLVEPSSPVVLASEDELVAIAEREFWLRPRPIAERLDDAIGDALAKLIDDRQPIPRHPSAPLPRPPSSLSFSDFCASLGAPLRNFRWSWSAMAPDGKRILVTVWDDLIHNGTYALWSPRDTHINNRNGAIEIRDIAEAALAGKSEVLGIRCFAKDRDGVPRRRERYDDKRLLVLDVFRAGADISSRIVGDVGVTEARNGPLSLGSIRYTVPQSDAVDDLDDPPPGTDKPIRAAGAGGGGYQRDPDVRAYVLKRARGRCEYCGKLGFEMGNRRRYLETHHVIALANQGADRVDNVIAVCSEHHRQAHYGRNSAALERQMLAVLARTARRRQRK